MKKRFRIAPEVREQILKRIKEVGVSVSVAATDAGIHETTIYGWLGTGAEGAPSGGESAKLKRENKALLELVGEVTLKLSESKKRSDPKHEKPLCDREIARRPCFLSGRVIGVGAKALRPSLPVRKRVACAARNAARYVGGGVAARGSGQWWAGSNGYRADRRRLSLFRQATLSWTLSCDPIRRIGNCETNMFARSPELPCSRSGNRRPRD